MPCLTFDSFRNFPSVYYSVLEIPSARHLPTYSFGFSFCYFFTQTLAMRVFYKKLRRLDTDSDQPTPEIMSTPPTPTSPQGQRVTRDTGFPEPFGDSKVTSIPEWKGNLLLTCC